MSSSCCDKMRALLLIFVASALLFTTCAAHAFMTKPRCRGALRTERNISPKVIDPEAPIDYCPGCQNAGGVYHTRGGYGSRWSPYEPLVRGRGGFGMCGDRTGEYAHMRAGRLANPPSTQYVETYAPGSIANFEVDFTANHGGYLEFYLCDVSRMDYNDIALNGFSDHCHYLKRVPNADCQSGNDYECGPVDPAFPGRWVVPCGFAYGDTGDQVVGGSNGKMAYRIPNVYYEDAVIQMYWWTANACMEPSGFMENYKYPQAWGTCSGDGGVVGGKPIHHKKCNEPGEWPEEFWNCADVQIVGPSQGDGDEKYSWYTGDVYTGYGNPIPAGSGSSGTGDYVPSVDATRGGYNDARASNGGGIVNGRHGPGEKCAGAPGYPSIPYIGCVEEYLCIGEASDWGKICVYVKGTSNDGNVDDQGFSYNPLQCQQTRDCGCQIGRAVCSICPNDMGSSFKERKVCWCTDYGEGDECNPLKPHGPFYM